MRRLIAMLLVIGLSALVGWRLWVTAVPTKGDTARAKAPIAIEWTEATKGDIEDIVEFTGSLAGKAEVVVSSKIAGRIDAIHVDLGDNVKKDQLLIELDQVELLHAVEEAKARLVVTRASLEELQANLTNAESELQRLKTLRERKVASTADVETAEATYLSLLARQKVSEASIRQQEAALQAEEVRLSYAKILAPISGVVGKRHLDEGAVVTPTTSILSLADITTVKTTIGVVERDYAKIETGLEASLSVDAYPGVTFKGSVSRIAPVLDTDTRSAEVEIEVPNPDGRLKPGMFTRVRIHFGTHQGVTLIPSRALVKRDLQEGIFIPSVDGKTARFVVVQTGLANVDHVEVKEIEPGQHIIVIGQHLLNDGDAIVGSQKVKSAEPSEPTPAGTATQ